MVHSLRAPALLHQSSASDEYGETVGADVPLARPMRVLLVDAQFSSRRAACLALMSHPALAVIGEAASGADAMALATATQPDIVILDARLPDMTGVALTRRLLATMPGLRVVLLSAQDSEDLVVEAVRAGAFGYLMKDIAPDALARAIAGVAVGEVAMSRRTAARLMERFRAASLAETSPLPDLTGREVEVLRLLSDGATDREIADRLVIAESTAKKHVQHILRKLRARNRAEAVAKYQRYSC